MSLILYFVCDFVAYADEMMLLMQYTLSKETTDYLKQPTFDMWHWEPNEVMICSSPRCIVYAWSPTKMWSPNEKVWSPK